MGLLSFLGFAPYEKYKKAESVRELLKDALIKHLIEMQSKQSIHHTESPPIYNIDEGAFTTTQQTLLDKVDVRHVLVMVCIVA